MSDKRQKGLALLGAALWLVISKLGFDHGARLLPDAVRRELTLEVYLASVAALSGALGLGLLSRLGGPVTRERFGLQEGWLGRSVALSWMLTPAIFVLALGSGIYVALPTLLEEFSRGGAQISRQNLGEFGRVVRASPLPVTFFWVVFLAPITEELLFRGALWGAIRGLTAPRPAEARGADEVSLAGVIDQSAAEKLGRGAWGWLREGGLATLITTALFVSVHLGTPGGAGIILVVSTLILGLFLGMSRHLSGSLLPPMVLHAFYNLLGLGHARGWFVSEFFPKDFGVPRLLIVAGGAGALAALLFALATRRRATAAVAAALAVAAASREASAGGVVGEGPQRRVEQETVLVVWDHERRAEHLLIAARASGLKGAGAYLASLPPEAEILQPLDGIPEAIARLLPQASPLPSTHGDGPSLAPRPGGLGELCKTLKLTCQAGALGWAAEGSKSVALLPLPAPGENGLSTAAYAHFRVETPRPFVPFAEPVDEAQPEPEPPLPGPDHPPRVRVWLELFNESKTGRWERQMDDAAEASSAALSTCYEKALQQRRKLSGDVHIRMRSGADNLVTDEEESASNKALEPVARCYAAALSKAAWPKHTFQRAVPFAVHASLKPPAPTARKLLAVVLSTQDAEPRLGPGDDPRVVPDLRPLTSVEPEPAQLAAAFPEPLRKTLGIDPERRFRLVAFESGADPHGQRHDIELRPLALAPEKPGAAPMPIVARGDRPPDPPAPPPRHRWGRRAKLMVALLAVAALVAFVVWKFFNEDGNASTTSPR